MSTYIAGITDFIPQIQPYKPDLNFYGSMLSAKQGKYDQAKTKINSLYGSLLYSPLTRDSNITRRDEFFKAVDNDIKRISGMDLSLQQNVEAASQIFEPFIQDKYIMSDMIWTKKFNNEYQRAENMRFCTDPKECGGSFWEEGLQAMNLKRDEFRNASDDESLSFENPRFTPFHNITEKAVRFAKDMGFNVSSVSSNGKYLITTKNGQQIKLPLAQLFMSIYANDPGARGVVDTQSYLARKSFVSQNAYKYGSEDAAEDVYFKNFLSTGAKSLLTEAQEVSTNLNNAKSRKDALEAKVKREGATRNDELFEAWANTEDEIAVTKGVDGSYQQVKQSIQGIPDIMSNRKALRNRIDSLMGSYLLQSTLGNAANLYGELNQEMSIVADPYAKSYYDYTLDLAKMQKQAEIDIATKVTLAALGLGDNQTMNSLQLAGPTEYNVPNVRIGETNPGSSTPSGAVDLNNELRDSWKSNADKTQQLSMSYIETLANQYQNVINSSFYSDAEKTSARNSLKSIFGQDYNPSTDWKDTPAVKNNWREIYKNAKATAITDKALLGNTYSTKLQPIEEAYNRTERLWVSVDKILKDNNSTIRQLAQSSILIDEESKPEFDLLFDEKNNVRSKPQFVKDWAKDFYQKYPTANTNRPADVKRVLARANEAYDKQFANYKKLYNQGAPGMKVLNSSMVLAGNASGGKTGNAVEYKFDEVFPAAFSSRAISELKNIKGVVSESYGLNLDNRPVESTNARLLLDKLLSDMSSGGVESKAAMGSRARGSMKYFDVALGDPNKASITIYPDASWLLKNSTDKKTKAFGKAIGDWKDGVTIYFDKNDNPNSISQALKASEADIHLNAGPYTISREKAGQVSISKRPDGSLNIEGAIVGYDSTGAKKAINPANTFSPGVDNQLIIDTYTNWMDQVNKANIDFLEGRNNQEKVYDPKQLIELKNQLYKGQQSTPDPMGIFNQMLNNR